MPETFRTKIVQGASRQVTGIVVPQSVMAALGPRKNPPVKVTLNCYTYRSSVAVMGGRFMIALSKENRTAAGLRGDETIEVTIEMDTEPRIVSLPPDLHDALRAAGLSEAFDCVSPSRRKEFVRQVESAKAEDTRQRRIAKIVDALR